MRLLLATIMSVMLGAFLSAEETLPPAQLSPDQEITLLISIVENTDATFHRNGRSHTAEDGADHLRLKYRRGAKYAKTTEVFIANLATKSSWSGKLYEIEFADGSREPFGDWLTKKLRDLRTVSP